MNDFAENAIALRELADAMDATARSAGPSLSRKTDFEIISNVALSDDCAALARDGVARWVGPLRRAPGILRIGDCVVLSPGNYHQLKRVAA